MRGPIYQWVSKDRGTEGRGCTWRRHFIPVCLGIIEQHHEGGHPEIFWLPIETKKAPSELLNLVIVFLRNMIDLNM